MQHGWKARRDAARAKRTASQARIRERTAIRDGAAKPETAAPPEPEPAPTAPPPVAPVAPLPKVRPMEPANTEGLHVKNGGFGRYYLMDGEKKISGPHKKDEAESLLAQQQQATRPQ